MVAYSQKIVVDSVQDFRVETEGMEKPDVDAPPKTSENAAEPFQSGISGTAMGSAKEDDSMSAVENRGILAPCLAKSLVLLAASGNNLHFDHLWRFKLTSLITMPPRLCPTKIIGR